MIRKRTKHYLFLRRLPASLPWGGLEKLMLEWFERIDYAHCRVTLAVTPGGKALFARQFSSKPINIEIIEFPFDFQGGAWQSFLEMSFFFHALKPSTIIFIQGAFTDFRLSNVLAAFLSAPGKVFMHENLGPPGRTAKSSKKHFGFISGMALWWHIPRYLASLRAYFSRRIIVVSNEIKEQLISCWRYPRARVQVCYHGIDIHTYAPSLEERRALRESLNIAAQEVLIILTARLAEQKRVDRVIEAFDLVSKNFPNTKLLIVGRGPLDNELRGLAQSKACSSRILFLGHVDNVSEYLKMSDINILSSDNEGFGIALVEALATGLICVSTKCPGPNEIIQDGVNGFLVEKSVAGVAAGLLRALQLSDQAKIIMSQNAREHVCANFEINKNVYNALGALQVPYLGKP